MLGGVPKYCRTWIKSLVFGLFFVFRKQGYHHRWQWNAFNALKYSTLQVRIIFISHKVSRREGRLGGGGHNEKTHN